jgi:hypothetical protein
MLERMNWIRWQTKKGNFELGQYDSIDAPGGLYSIDVLTGTVMFDSSPPSTLPPNICAHELYRRTFGGREFDAAVSKNGVFTTTRPVMFGLLQ